MLIVDLDVQVSNAVFPDEWFTSVSVYDGSTTVINGTPSIIAAGLTPNTSSVFCHARATPTNLSDPALEDWAWDPVPVVCGSRTNGLTPFDAPTSAWQTTLGQWQYQDGRGNVFVSDDGKMWRGATGKKYPGGTVCDFFPLPRTCAGCDGSDSSNTRSTNRTQPTHVHEAANRYSLVVLIEGGRDDAGSLTAVPDGGASVASAASMGLVPNCDHGNFGYPKSFHDPVKNRRLQYGWVQGAGLGGEEDAKLGPYSLKNNHQSLLREVTYDPRLGMLQFFPVEETNLLRGGVLSAITTPTPVPPSGVLSLPTPATVANQSEVRVSFAVPTAAVTFGISVMTSAAGQGMEFTVNFVPAPAGVAAWMVGVGHSGSAAVGVGPSSVPSATPGYGLHNGSDCNGGDIPHMDIRLPKRTTDIAGLATCAAVCNNHSACGAFVFVSGDAGNPTPGGPRCAFKAVGSCQGAFRGPGCTCGIKDGTCGAPPPPPPGPGPPGPPGPPPPAPRPPPAPLHQIPMLSTDKTVDIVLYVDHTVVEAYFMGGRYALTQHVPADLLLPLANNTLQGAAIVATGAGAVVLNATIWRMNSIWDDVPTHGRPWRK